MTDEQISINSIFRYVLKKWKSILLGTFSGLLVVLCLDILLNNGENTLSGGVNCHMGLTYVIESDSPGTVAGVYGIYTLRLRSGEFADYMQSETGLKPTKLLRLITVDNYIEEVTYDSSSHIAGFVITISGDDAERISSILSKYVDNLTTELQESGLTFTIHQIDDGSVLTSSESRIPSILLLAAGGVLGMLVMIVFHACIFMRSDKLDV